MFKKLLNSKDDFDRWIKKQEEIIHNDSFDWELCDVPENYPCIVVWCIIEEAFYENDSLFYNFVYSADFTKK